MERRKPYNTRIMVKTEDLKKEPTISDFFQIIKKKLIWGVNHDQMFVFKVKSSFLINKLIKINYPNPAFENNEKSQLWVDQNCEFSIFHITI